MRLKSNFYSMFHLNSDVSIYEPPIEPHKSDALAAIYSHFNLNPEPAPFSSPFLKIMCLNEILAIEHDERLNSISQIIDAEVRAKEYEAIFTHGSVNWINTCITSDSHPKVKEYHSKTSQSLQVHSLAQALWMNPVWENV